MLGLAAYLKSSFVLWYITTIHESDDLFAVLMRSHGDFLVPKQTEGLKRLATFVHNILLAETAILRQLARPEKEQDKSRVSREVEKHNTSVAPQHAAYRSRSLSNVRRRKRGDS